jgi:hypothetical protein
MLPIRPCRAIESDLVLEYRGGNVSPVDFALCLSLQLAEVSIEGNLQVVLLALRQISHQLPVTRSGKRDEIAASWEYPKLPEMWPVTAIRSHTAVD